MLFLGSLLIAARLHASTPTQPWRNRALSPDARATLLEARMTPREMLLLVDGKYAEAATFMPGPHNIIPPGAIGSAGYIPGVPRLGIPALQESDAGVGVADPIEANGKPVRGAAGYSVALPSGLATAATWNPQLAYAGGSMIGHEAHEEGFNVLLAGGLDLARDPRNGRNFEYAGEDPLLAGTMVGNAIAGIQSQHVISTAKHFALNDQETNRGTVSADIARTAARESDLLAFEIAIGIGKPGAIMCSYNRVNGVYACDDPYLLNETLKRDWRYPGFVMSDWGAVHSVDAARSGLDQESGDYLDDKVYFSNLLEQAIAQGRIPKARLHDMVHRILRSMFAQGLFDDPPVLHPIDARGDAAVAQADEEQGAVLLKNGNTLLPLPSSVTSVAVIGGHADVGVLSGGGSSQVWPVGGPGLIDNTPWPGPVIWDPSSPLRAIAARAPHAHVTYYDGSNPKLAASYAASAQVAIVFAYQWLAESIDAPSLSLPDNQDALIASVAAANPHTIVVLETGDPVTMPWLSQTDAVLEAWYPGQSGGDAIARLLFGDVSPSGRLPLTFPQDASQLPRPRIPSAQHIDYDLEGADVGYRWYQRQGEKPLFAFGYGLTYTTFAYSSLRVTGGTTLHASFTVTNTGAREAADVPQVYVALPASSGERALRLAGWQKIDLRPGQTRRISLMVDPRVLARFDGRSDDWRVTAGTYTVHVGASAEDLRLQQHVNLAARRIAP